MAFLVVNLVMETLGWVVGAPGAAARYTMLTVMFAGNLGAALAYSGTFSSLQCWDCWRCSLPWKDTGMERAGLGG
ncbi:MAG: hypothetical protein R3300_21020 [Candidatus Promineifilaceae bacterium]|nr:hypothetical protein [Candidatus Promineifilaceae bacterium]